MSFEAPPGDLVSIGRSSLRVPSLGVGAWSWGDARYWGFGTRHGPRDVVDAYAASVEGGARLFDTAEVYGHGDAEKALGWLARRPGPRRVVATKFAPLRGRGGPAAVLPALRASLRRMGLGRVDLYQVHWADSEECPVGALMGAMADAVAAGLAGAVGVSNFTAAEMREAHAALARRGVPLASNQVRYSLLHRAPEVDGVADACRELGVTLLAYSPLEQGILCGSYGPDRVPEGPRAEAPWFARDNLLAAAPVVELLRELGRAHGDRPPEQVALNWLRAKPGVIPLAGARTGAQAGRNVGALAWALPEADAARLDAATSRWARAVRDG
jgi:aryl-alcohol dehydrogenase-like predicted oxidoreductase